MKKFEFKKEKLKPLTLQDVRDLGWEEKKVGESGTLVFFEKGNYFLSVFALRDDTAVLRFIAKDPTKIDWMPDPEQFRISIRCPSKEHFEVITSLL
jgi:hypothetical protein